MFKYKKYFLYSIVFFILATTVFADEATTTDVLKTKIDERTNQIKQLEVEIKQYNNEVLNAGNEAKTLQTTLKTLDLTKKKINTDISLTENKIVKTNLTIEQLGIEIGKTKDHISLNRLAVIDAMKNAQSLEDMGPFQIILSKKSFNEIWTDIDNNLRIQETIRERSKELAVLSDDMHTKQGKLSGEKTSLVGLKQDLTGKQLAVQQTAAEKASLLSQTKNKEQAFKELVKTKEQQKEQFEKEIFEYESQLEYLIDKGSYPNPKKGILSWPLENVYVTQKFGKTVGAEKLYVSGSHNGVDFRSSTGTKVKNVLSGTVVGTGNTDAYPGCYSFGKWVMVKHDNGLSTIYGHLSSISAVQGQRMQTGDTIGYSGNTGYSTGPHLHISVYATQGVRIEKYVNSRGCKEATMPLADIKAYLDPLAYFPSL